VGPPSAMVVAAWERAQAYRSRHLLAVAGVAVSVCAVVMATTLVNSGMEAATANLRELGAQTYFLSARDLAEFGKGGRPIQMADVAELRRHATSLESVAPLIMLRGTAVVCGARKTVTIVGVLPSHQQLLALRMTAGRFIAAADVSGRAKAGVVDQALRKEWPCIDLDRRIIVSGVAYHVVGAVEPQSTLFRGRGEPIVYLPLTLAETRYGSLGGTPLTLVVRARQGADRSTVEAEVRSVLRRSHGSVPGQPDDFILQSQADLIRLGASVARLASVFITGFLGVSLVVAGIGMTNSLTNGVISRSEEIGLRRAVGARREDIRRQFMAEALGIVALGWLAGVMAGLATAAGITRILDVSLAVDWPSVVVSAVATVAIGVTAGIAPAMRAARFEPSDALRCQ
jgi:putative ABC transport system permease protein